MRHAFACVVALVVLAGCGTPSSLEKQAEDVSSTAAEGALLAHDASEGDTTETFTTEHSKALRKKLESVSGAIDDRRLARIAETVATDLEQLEQKPDDEQAAAAIERRLDQAAKAAEEVGKTG